MYQREYKWENEKISALISDIRKQRKFLGNIILDEAVECHEIADGQQRITTCYLILVYLYNFYHGSPLEQQSLLHILKPYGEFVLENDTVNTFLYETQGNIELRVLETADIYFQKADFERAYEEIGSALSFLATPEQARDFKDKLLNSEVLVLINDEHPTTPNTNFNLEHFVIPDQRAAKIRWWVDDTQYFNIEINLDFAKRNKKRTCNLLVIDHNLNEDIDNYDIVKKIEMIQSWHSARGLSLPAHIDVFFSFIQEMPEYQVLQQHKDGEATEEAIKVDYQLFLTAYFAEEKENNLLFNLGEQFKSAFRN